MHRNCCNRFDCGCNHFDCGYINRPYTNLRPFTNFNPCPKFSCPPINNMPNCGCFPHLNQWNNCGCFPNFNPNFCCPPNCVTPRDLLFFMGGCRSREHRREPCQNRRIISGQDEF